MREREREGKKTKWQCAHMHTYTHKHTHAHMYAHTYICTHTSINTYTVEVISLGVCSPEPNTKDRVDQAPPPNVVSSTRLAKSIF